jgi:hypothetical protein
MKNKIAAAAWSASITMIVMVAVIITGEYVASFNAFLASLTGHHWVTKSVFEVVLFVVLFVVFAFMMKKDKKAPMKGVMPTFIVGLASIAVLVVFYVLHFMGKL